MGMKNNSEAQEAWNKAYTKRNILALSIQVSGNMSDVCYDEFTKARKDAERLDSDKRRYGDGHKYSNL